MIKITYSSNNSGGSWWLKDEDWRALEKAGWTVKWGEDRFLGALATTAHKTFETPVEAMSEFEAITGQDVSDEGCNCCGAPHTFYWGEEKTYGYASGESCLPYLYGDDAPKSLREALERERK